MRAFDKAIFRILRRLNVKDAPIVNNDPDAEDGGPGSGNWGHRGRPGERGGSGKGGGTHYRGGRADMGEFFGTRSDWLNGLNGERQRNVTNMLKTFGSGDIKAGERTIMQGKNIHAKAEYLTALAEARKWDDHSEKYHADNLTEEESDLLDSLDSKLQNDTIAGRLDEAKTFLTPEEFTAYTDLLAKAMGGETSGEDIATLLAPKIDSSTIAGKAQLAKLKAQQRAAGKCQGEPDGEVAKALGSNYSALNDMVTNCQSASAQAVWDGFEREIVVTSTNANGRQCYHPGRGIDIDIAHDMTAHGCYAAGESVFHECGHMIDDLLGQQRGGGYYSSTYNNGEFVRVMHDEVSDWVSEQRKALRAEIEQRREPTPENISWLNMRGYISYWDAAILRGKAERGEIADLSSVKIPAAKLDKEIGRRLALEARQAGTVNYGAICDVTQGATKSRVESAVGHNKSYYTGGDSRRRVATEAFTELFAGHFTNPKANELFRQRFPKTYAVFERMLADAFS